MNRKITGNTAPLDDHHKKIRVCYRCAGKPKYEGAGALGMETCENCGRLVNSTDMHVHMIANELVVEDVLGIQTAYMVEEKYKDTRTFTCIDLTEVERIEYTHQQYEPSKKMVRVIMINDRREFYEIADMTMEKFYKDIKEHWTLYKRFITLTTR